MVPLIRLRSILPLLAVLACYPFICGFVLLSGSSEAIMDVSVDQPTIEFVLSNDYPNMKNVDKFSNGQYVDLEGVELWQAVVQESMDLWNDVSDSYIQLSFTGSDGTSFDDEDLIHTIGTKSINLTSGASASPKSEDGIILDCDITVNSRSSVDTSYLAYAMAHELGHCLGFGHNHGNYDSLMGYSRSSKSLRLSLDDRAGLVYLYPNDDMSKSTETLGCGAIALPSQGKMQSLLFFLMMLLPVGISWWRWRLKTSDHILSA